MPINILNYSPTHFFSKAVRYVSGIERKIKMEKVFDLADTTVLLYVGTAKLECYHYFRLTNQSGKSEAHYMVFLYKVCNNGNYIERFEKALACEGSIFVIGYNENDKAF